MSNYEEDQSEDGELAQSPTGHDYSLSSDGDGDGEPPDALTIKPPPPRAAEGSRDRRHRHQARRERSARRDKKRAYRERDPVKRDDMTKYPDSDIYYAKEIYREREYVREREYPREKEAYRSGPRVHLRDKEYKEKEVYRDAEVYREKDAYRDKESYRSKDVYREKEHHKEKEVFRDKDPYREKEVYFVRDKERVAKVEPDRLKNTYRHSEMEKKASLREEARLRHIEDESRVKDMRYNEKENRDKLSGDKELEDLRSRLLSKRQTKEQQQDVPRKRDDRMDFSPERQQERRDKFKKSERESVSKKREERIDFSPEREMSRVSLRLPELDESQLERRERLLKTEREMSHRKKASREALAARREKLKESAAKRAQMTSSPVQRKRHRHSHLPSPQTPSDVVTVSDASDMDTKEKLSDEASNNSEEGEGSGSSTDTSSRSNTDSDTEEEEDEEEEDEDREEDRDSDERPKNSYKNNKIESEGRVTEPPSPHNIDSSPLSTHSVTPKHSISRSPSRSRSSSPPLLEENGTVPEPVPEEPVKTPPPTPPPDERLNLPVYYPGIQGCRSVEEFQCLNRIEEGTYGVVYRARDKTSDEIVALKRLKMEKEKEGFPITSLREINTLLKGQHPNIVTVREIVVGSNMDKIFIVMDYVEHDLKGLMETMRERKQVFIPGEVKCLMQQLLRAVDHLHDNWILHRDLKTSNLLLSHKGILKVGDFGLAREYGSPLKSYTPVVVTLWYRAPELLLGAKQYSTHIDIWSVGCIFAEFITMHALFPGKSEVDQLNKIFKELGTPNELVWPGWSELSGSKATWADQPGGGLRTRVGTQLTDVGLQLLQGLLKYDPQRRITAHDALAHAYFKEKPMAIDPAMFPTWPAKSEGGRRHQHSPKPPSGGDQYKLLRDEDQATSGFHMGQPAPVTGPFLPPVATGFSLKF